MNKDVLIGKDLEGNDNKIITLRYVKNTINRFGFDKIVLVRECKEFKDNKLISCVAIRKEIIPQKNKVYSDVLNELDIEVLR